MAIPHTSRAVDDSIDAVTWQSIHRLVTLRRRYDTARLRQILNDPDAAFAEPGVELLKSDSTTSVAIVDGGALRLVVKRYNLRSPVHALRQSVRRSRAARCWRSAHRLHANRLATAPPVAYVEDRLGPLRRRAWYVCEFVPGVQALEYFTGEPLPPEAESVAKRIGELFAAMARARITHGDLKATNIIISDGQPVLVDLDAMRHHCAPWTYRAAARADRARFMRNWQALPAVHRRFDMLLAGG